MADCVRACNLRNRGSCAKEAHLTCGEVPFYLRAHGLQHKSESMHLFAHAFLPCAVSLLSKTTQLHRTHISGRGQCIFFVLEWYTLHGVCGFEPPKALQGLGPIDRTMQQGDRGVTHCPAGHCTQRGQHDEVEGDYAADWVAGQPKND